MVRSPPIPCWFWCCSIMFLATSLWLWNWWIRKWVWLDSFCARPYRFSSLRCPCLPIAPLLRVGNPQKRRRCWKPCVTLWNPVPQKCSTGHLEVYFPGFSTWQCDCSIRCFAVNSIRQKRRNIALHSCVLCVYISILTTSTLREPKNSSLIAIGPDAKSMGFLEKEVPEVLNGSVICRPRGFFESTWMIHQLEAALLFQCFLNDNYSFSCAHW